MLLAVAMCMNWPRPFVGAYGVGWHLPCRIVGGLLGASIGRCLAGNRALDTVQAVVARIRCSGVSGAASLPCGSGRGVVSVGGRWGCGWLFRLLLRDDRRAGAGRGAGIKAVMSRVMSLDERHPSRRRASVPSTGARWVARYLRQNNSMS